MSEVAVSPSELHDVAAEFAKASHDSKATIRRLEALAAHVQEKWSHLAGGAFSTYFKEWRGHMQGHVALLDVIAHELHAAADHFERADS